MYLINTILLIYLFKDFVGLNFFSLLFGLFISSLFVQVIVFDKKNPKRCLEMFKINNFSGLIFFIAILMVNN